MAPRLHILRVTPWPPTRFLGVLRGFWGLEGSIGVRLQCLGSQKNGNLSLNGMQTKNEFLVTPNFQGPWSSKIGPWGFRGSCGVKKTILTYFLAQNTPWYIKQNLKNLLPSMKSMNGSQKRVRRIFKHGLIFLQWSVENIPQRTFIQTLPFKKYTISSEWTQIGYPWGVRLP